MFQIGYEFNPYIAIEGRYTMSAGDISVSDNLGRFEDQDIDADISNLAIYVKPMYPIGDFTLYGLLGYGQVTVDIDDESIDDSGFQWGLGASYAFSDNLAIFADYTKWYDDDFYDEDGFMGANTTESADLDAITFGLTYKF